MIYCTRSRAAGRTLTIGLAIALTQALTGCSSQPQTPAAPPPLSRATADKLIQDVQGNKNIPDAAKPRVIAQINGRVK